MCIVLNPHCSNQEKMHWKQLLEKWTRNEVCPQEDPDFRPQPMPRIEAVSWLKKYFYVFVLYNLFTAELYKNAVEH